MHVYEELSEPPVLTPKGLRLSVRQEKKRVLGVFGGGDNSKLVNINSSGQAEVSIRIQHLPVEHLLGRQYCSTFLLFISVLCSQAIRTSMKQFKGLFGMLRAISTGVRYIAKDVNEIFQPEKQNQDSLGRVPLGLL